jgi:hypothetical protein
LQLKNHTKQNNSLKKWVAQLELKEDLEITCDDDVVGVMEACLQHCNENSGKLNAHIVQVLIETMIGYNVDDNNATLKAELEEHATAVCSNLENYAKQILGKPTTVKFDSQIFHIALGCWLEKPSSFQHL